MDSKSPFKSKTLWTNIIMGIGAMLIPDQGIFGNVLNAPEYGAIMGAVNIALRFFTEKKILF